LKHEVGKVFNSDGDLIGGTVFLSSSEVKQFETTGSVCIEK